MSNYKKAQVVNLVQCLSKKDLLIHLMSALKSESFLYASILKSEILSRSFTEQEKKVIRQSSFYPQLNGVLDN